MDKRESTRFRFMEVWPKTKKNLTDVAHETKLHRATLYKFINNIGRLRDTTVTIIAHWVVENEKQLYFADMTIGKIVDKYADGRTQEGDFYDWAKTVYERIQLRMQEKKQY